MIKFYTNQELSRGLNIKLARWKRWSREFLPPDPLGGFQSGFARQYNPDEAFTVFLGGYLVGDLKFSIPEARLILHDLGYWLAEHKFYFGYTDSIPSPTKNIHKIQYYQIAICHSPGDDTSDSGFFYFAKGVIANESTTAKGIPVSTERFVEAAINSGKNATQIKEVTSFRVLNITLLRKRFLNSLKRSKAVT
jgi:hypothetical protein